MTYAQVILPLPLQGGFTYEVPPEAERQLRIGARVIVPFGRRKFYTGIVDSVSDRKPEGYELKAIAAVLDSGSLIIKRPQIQLWNWIADYYLKNSRRSDEGRSAGRSQSGERNIRRAGA